MKTLLNGEFLVQALLASKYSSKIGFTVIYAKRTDDGIVACYAMHKNKHYVLSTKIAISIDSDSIPIDEYMALAIANALEPYRVCFVFESREKLTKTIKRLIETVEYNSSVFYMDEFSLENKATHALSSLIMHAEDGLYLNDICEMDISQKATTQEYRAEVYKLLGVYPEKQMKYFPDAVDFSNKKELHGYLSANLPKLKVHESIIYSDCEPEMLYDVVERIDVEKADLVIVDDMPDFKLVNGVLAANPNALISDADLNIVEGSVDL